jgi:acetyltransferase-like isoleucine patch superfamily enzyme
MNDYSSLRRTVLDDIRGLTNAARMNRIATWLIPQHCAPRTRAELLRRTGWRIGEGAMFMGVPTIVGTGRPLKRLRVGRRVFVNVGGYWELNDCIEIDDGVSIGHEVMLLTTTHVLGDGLARAGELRHGPIHIGAGVWIGARSTVLPGVTIGSGAVIAAATVVRRDVPPNTMVGGNPAAVIKSLDGLLAVETAG